MRKIFFFVLLAAPFAAHGADAQEAVPEGRLPRDVTPVYYRLDLTIVPSEPRFSGHTEIDVSFAAPTDSFFLHGRDLSVTQVQVRTADGAVIVAQYEQVHETGVARVTLAETAPAGEAMLVFDYDAHFNGALSGLYNVHVGEDSYVFSQLETIHARRIFPSFDQPEFKTPFDITITARAEDEVVINTMPMREEPLLDGLKRITFITTEKLPTYLLAFAVGPLEIVQGPDIPANEIRDRPLPLRGATVRGKGDEIRYALNHTPDIVTVLERYFGTPYPYSKLDLIAAPDFGPGAMENAGAVVYRETVILMKADAPLQQRRSHIYIHAHELAHQWFGDLVTPAWWDDIWLNESFATWMGHKATDIWFPEGEFGREILDDALDVMELDVLPSARRIREPVKDSNDIANAFDGISYAKGGGVLAMFETYLGEEVFREGVRLYLRRFGNGTATSDNFLQALADGAGRPEVVEAFSSFLEQPGVPVVISRPTCLGGAGGQATLRQRPYAPIGVSMPEKRWTIPVCLRALDGRGEKQCTVLGAAERSMRLGPVCSGALMPNVEGAGYYRFDFPQGDFLTWRELIEVQGKLSPAEKVTLLANLDAAVRAGAPASMLFEGLNAIAPSGPWDSAARAAQILSRLYEYVAEEEMRPKWSAYARSLLGSRFASIGVQAKPGEKVGDALLRPTLAWFLIETGEDAELRDSLAQSGKTYLFSGGRDGEDISPDLMTVALWSALAQGETDVEEQALAVLRNYSNAEFRRAVLFALGASPHAFFRAQARDLILSDDLRLNESTLLLRYFLGARGRRAETWDWIKTNIVELERHFTRQRMVGVLQGLGGTCESDMRGDVEAFFTSRIESYEGGARQLALALQAMDRCVALKNAKAHEFTQALNALQ